MCNASPLPPEFETLIREFLNKAAVMPIDGDLELHIMEAHRTIGPLLAEAAIAAREQANASQEAAFPPSGLPNL